MSNFLEVCPLRAEVFYAYGHKTDRHTDMTALIVFLAVLPVRLIMLRSFIYLILTGIAIVWDAPKLNLLHKM